MALDPVSAVAGLADTVISRLWPDKTEQERAQMAAALTVVQGQLDTNKAEAAGGGYKAGWRPTIGYVCAAALAWAYIGNPVVTWAVAIWAPGTAIPNIVIDDHLWELMLGMLGLAGWRTMDKVKGKE